MVLPVPAGDRGVAFRAFGFPVRVQPFFFLIMGFLGYAPGDGITRVLVFIAVALVAVLLHELGHAFAARSSGHTAEIVLYGFGGATMHRGPQLSRARSALISFAGPGVGLVAGGLLLALRDALPQVGYGGFAVDAALFLTIGLGVLNLLPILPLDGGQLLASVLPGDEYQRTRTAAVVGVVVAAAAGALAYANGLTISIAIAAWLAIGNVMTARQRRPARTMSAVEVERAAVSLVDAGRADQAIHLVVTTGTREEIDEGVIALLRTANGDPDGFAAAEAALDAAPTNPARQQSYVRAAVLAGAWDALLSRSASLSDPGLLRWAADRAVIAGRDDVATAIGGTESAL